MTDYKLLRLYADERLRRSDFGIGAAFARNVTEPDRDGRLFELVATDGSDYATITVVISRWQPDRELSAEVVEAAVERRSGDYARETRLRDLAAGLVELHLD